MLCNLYIEDFRGLGIDVLRGYCECGHPGFECPRSSRGHYLLKKRQRSPWPPALQPTPPLSHDGSQ